MNDTKAKGVITKTTISHTASRFFDTQDTLGSLVQFESAFHFHESYHVQLKIKLQSKNCCHETKGLAIF